MSDGPKVIEVRVNCPSREVAAEISKALIDRKLVGAINVYDSLQSTYFWEGALNFRDEVLLVAKSLDATFPAIEAVVRDHHPYKVPSILGMPAFYVNDDYRAWLLALRDDVVAADDQKAKSN